MKTVTRHSNTHANLHARHAINAKVLKKLKQSKAYNRLQQAKDAYSLLEGNAARVVAKSIKKAKVKSINMQRSAKKLVVKHPFVTTGVILSTCAAAIGLYLFNRK